MDALHERMESDLDVIMARPWMLGDTENNCRRDVFGKPTLPIRPGVQAEVLEPSTAARAGSHPPA